MQKVRVAHVVNSLAAGGGERLLVDLVKCLPRDQFDPHVICLYEAGRLTDQLTAVGIPVTVLGISWKIRPKGYRTVYSMLRGRNFQILHTHSLEACWHALPAAWMARVPVRIAHLQNCHWTLPLKLRLLDRLSFQFAQAGIGCSRAVVNFYRDLMWYPAEKLHVAYNAIDTTRFDRLPNKVAAKQCLGLSNEHLVITSVGSLKRQKGHRYLLEAAIKILPKAPSAKFLFVGDGDQRDDLISRCEQWHLTSSVSFLSRRDDVPNILAASDIFVMPSLWEGLPIALVEAGLAGLPSVTSAVDGIPEVIQDGRNGLLVRPEDPDAIAEAVLRLADNPELRRQMGAEGRRLALGQFSIEVTAQRVLKIYQELLAAH